MIENTSRPLADRRYILQIYKRLFQSRGLATEETQKYFKCRVGSQPRALRLPQWQPSVEGSVIHEDTGECIPRRSVASLALEH